jgi:hypothetical protein
MISLLLILLLSVPSLDGQEIRRPTGRMIPGVATPTPHPCADCPAPGSFTCAMWPEVCYQCWEDCGQPIATPTPTPTSTPPPPTPTPTPNGPACELLLPSVESVYLVAFYLHGSESHPGMRYNFQTSSVVVPPGAIARPCPCQGHPVGFKWYTADGVLLKACGDTSTLHWLIFRDGLETGTTDSWSTTTGG